jgi:hypothetical protein
MNARIEFLTGGAPADSAWPMPRGYCAPYVPDFDQPPPLVITIVDSLRVTLRLAGRAGRFALAAGRAGLRAAAYTRF